MRGQYQLYRISTDLMIRWWGRVGVYNIIWLYPPLSFICRFPHWQHLSGGWVQHTPTPVQIFIDVDNEVQHFTNMGDFHTLVGHLNDSICSYINHAYMSRSSYTSLNWTKMEFCRSRKFNFCLNIQHYLSI